jgi:stearoyl-CoA desaturase (delta-9 desaturase)
MPEFGSWGTDWWKPVLFVIVAGHLTNICVTLFLHRAQTHRGVNFHWLVEMPMRVWLWLTTAIRTKEWVACHRKHHAFADREGDPHSPVVDGCATSCSRAPSTIARRCASPACSRSTARERPTTG